MKSRFKKIQTAPIHKDTIVLLRLDLNVPIADGKVSNDYRIRRILPTIEYIRSREAKIVIVSHIESDAGQGKTLEPICKHLSTLGVEATLVPLKKAREAIDRHDIVLIENIREHEGEKTDDPSFAHELATLADIYVNDAFAVSHRAHASVHAITAYIPSYAGLLFIEEVEQLSTAFSAPRPFLFALGGAKFDTKLPLIERYIKEADHIFVGGALANNFFLEQGFEVGLSVVSKRDFDLKRYFGNNSLLLPTDVVVSRNGERRTVASEEVGPSDTILDIGGATLEQLRRAIATSAYILWNGPMGNFEAGYKEPTLELAKAVAEATERGAKTIVGGGDTLAAIAELGLENKFSFVSTGGGAMLDFLATGTLPGIEALVSGE